MSPVLTDYFKPRPSEAIARLRSNGLATLTALIVVYLTPLPSPWVAFHIISTKADVSSFWWLLCVLELLVFGVLGFNMLQASYALQYPPVSQPLLSAPNTPAKPKPTPKSPAVASPRRLKGFTPVTSPQAQKAFSTSYASSPVSTPSRTLNYTIPPSANCTFDSSFNSSTMSLPNSPLAAYRGKHSTSVGRPITGDLLSRLGNNDSDED
ncbi:hypothetical protein C8Q75DRAFT_624480 [Abortiporus biennis]|nr:hypothetical protein C8Q75DRAFT_624480 [Abortiporus biennis]